MKGFTKSVIKLKNTIIYILKEANLWHMHILTDEKQLITLKKSNIFTL